MNQLLVGYARVSTEHQDLTAQRNSLAALGVGDDRIHVDHGLTGTNRDRPGLRLAEAACHSGDTVVVTKLDRLARSLPDARDILTELTQSSRGVSTPVREGLLRRRRGVASRFSQLCRPTLQRTLTGRRAEVLPRWPRTGTERAVCWSRRRRPQADPPTGARKKRASRRALMSHISRSTTLQRGSDADGRHRSTTHAWNQSMRTGPSTAGSTMWLPSLSRRRSAAGTAATIASAELPM
jgi:hypothetical protein